MATWLQPLLIAEPLGERGIVYLVKLLEQLPQFLRCPRGCHGAIRRVPDEDDVRDPSRCQTRRDRSAKLL